MKELNNNKKTSFEFSNPNEAGGTIKIEAKNSEEAVEKLYSKLVIKLGEENVKPPIISTYGAFVNTTNGPYLINQ